MIGPSHILGVRIMAFQDGMTTSEIATIFADEIASLGGSVSDTFDDGSRLFIRAVLPAELEVEPGDRVQGGVAIRATHDEVWIHPYVFRQVCQNGAIIAHAVQTHHIDRTEFSYDPDAELAHALRESVRECCEAEAFENATEAMQLSTQSGVDLALTIMPTLSRLPSEFAAEILGPVIDEFFKSERRSRFDLMNAVTAVARETTDPEVRWELEKIGGAVPFDVPSPVLKRSFVLTA
jgi:hypothetical protein